MKKFDEQLKKAKDLHQKIRKEKFKKDFDNAKTNTQSIRVVMDYLIDIVEENKDI